MSLETIIQATRTWITDTLNLTDPANQVIPVEREDSGPSPQEPYLTVEMIVFDIDIGVEQTIYETAQTRTQGLREGTLRIRGYGRGTAGQLSCLNLMKGSAPVNIVRSFGVQDISAQTSDTEIDEEYLLDFTVEYMAQLTTLPVTGAETLEFDGTIGSLDSNVTNT